MSWNRWTSAFIHYGVKKVIGSLSLVNGMLLHALYIRRIEIAQLIVITVYYSIYIITSQPSPDKNCLPEQFNFVHCQDLTPLSEWRITEPTENWYSPTLNFVSYFVPISIAFKLWTVNSFLCSWKAYSLSPLALLVFAKKIVVAILASCWRIWDKRSHLQVIILSESILIEKNI